MENTETKSGKGGMLTFFLIVVGVVAALVLLKMIIG